LGGTHFDFPCTLAANGIGVKLRSLSDTGANGYCFIDRTCADYLQRKLQARTVQLSNPCPVQGYDGAQGQHITNALVVDLLIDHRYQKEVPFLVLDLGQHDVIIGRKWMAQHGVMCDPRNGRLVWPESHPPDRQLPQLTYHDLPKHLVGRRQRNRSAPTATVLEDSTWTEDQQEAYARMDRALQGLTPEPLQLPSPRPEATLRARRERMPSRLLAPLDLAFIGAVPFARHTKNRDTTCGVLYLHEIDARIAELRAAEADLPEDEEEADRLLIKRRLPEEYRHFVDVFSKRRSNELPESRAGDHRIQLTKELPSTTSPLYSMSLEHLEILKQYLVDNLKKGFIVPSDAPFASPVLFAKKPGGGWRFCVDYRRLNEFTTKDRYPLPLIDETLTRLAKARIYTKLDIRQAFHRIRMHPDSEALTSFRTRYGQYKYRVLPFGLCNGPSSFQRYINEALFDYLDVFCTAYVDDILIYSEDPLEHAAHVQKVLTRLRQFGLQADIKKCEFGVTKTKFLGFIVSTDGIAVDPDKVAVVRDWAPPSSVKGVQSFLGFCNFYRRFVRNYGRLARPLIRLTHKGTPWDFDGDCLHSFQTLKDHMCQAPVLRHYDPDLPTRVETDASDSVDICF